MKLQIFLSIFCFAACQNNSGTPDFSSKTDEKYSSTKFELLSSQQTGLTFSPKIEENYTYNFSHDPNIYNGGGVAVIDFDNDGLQDLLFTARLQGCRLYRNLGGLKFEDVSEKSGISQHGGLKTGVTVVDINSDGWQDLYICRTWREPLPERRNLLLINNKNGTFSEHSKDFGLDDLSASQHANFFDYDLDGDLDVYLMNNLSEFKSINNLDFTPSKNIKTASAQPPRDEFESDKLFKNEGNGKFTDVSKIAGIQNRAHGLSCLTADFNDDGWPDIFVGNDFVMPDFLYLNNRNGTFSERSAESFRHISNHSMGSDFGDLNRDGLADLVVLDMLAENWERRQQLMSTMQLERDRKMQQLGYGRQAMRNVLQINNGLHDGLPDFSEIGCLAGVFATDWSWSPLLADFDNDGWQDLFISNGIKRDMNDLDFVLFTADSINRTGGINERRFKNFEEFSSLMPSHPVHNYMYQNRSGEFPLRDVSKNWGFTKTGLSNGAAYSDLDNDGDLDLVTNNLEAPPSIFENKANEISSNNFLQIKLAGQPKNLSGIGAKIRVTAGGVPIFFGEMATVHGFYSSVEPIFQVGLGSEKLVEKVEIEWPTGQSQVLENVAANQRITLKINDSRPGRLPKPVAKTNQFFEEKTFPGLHFRHTENAFEDFDRERLLPYRLSKPGPALAVGDVNSDGLEDVFVGGASGQAGQVFLQKTDGSFQNLPQPDFEKDKNADDACALFFDFEKDGDLDLLVCGGGNEWPAGHENYRPRLYLNDGKGHFSKKINAFSEGFSGCFSAAVAYDFSGDGKIDLVLGSRGEPGRFPESNRSCFLENDGQTFSNVTSEFCQKFEFSGMVTDLKFADFDGDGKAELLVAGDWMDLKIYKFSDGSFDDATQKFGLENSSGWWNCLTVKDLDGDGDLDFVAGNEGLNHRLGQSKNWPLRIFASDFDGNGSIDPVLCVAENGKFRPAATCTQFALQMPSLIKKRIHRYKNYATLGIEDIFSKDELAKANVWEAENLATGWFENTGGKFVRHDLPTGAQIAPAQAILAEDFSGDGKIDLLILGNDYESDIETYRQDASNGCFLVGQGGGIFKEIPARQSGLWAKKAARRAAVLHFKNGKRTVLVGNNDDEMGVFILK